MTCAIFDHVRISGIVTVVPSGRIKLDDEIQFYENNENKLNRLKMTVGLGMRSVADKDTTPGDMMFDAAAKLIDGMNIDINTSISMNFGKAIEALKAGSAIRRSGWNGKGLFVVKQVPSHITGDIIPKMQSLPQSAKDILMSRENPHIDYTNQMLIINPDGRADSWVPSSSDVFAEDWEIVE